MIYIKTQKKMLCKDVKPGDQLIYCIQNNCYATKIGKSTIKHNGIFCTRFRRKVKKILLSTIIENKQPVQLEPGVHEIIGKEWIKCSYCYAFNSLNTGRYEIY